MVAAIGAIALATWALAAHPAAPPGYAVRHAFTAPAAAARTRVTEALRAQLPDAFASPSAARRAVRRRLVLLDGTPCACDTVLRGGERLVVVHRAGEPEGAPGRPAAPRRYADRDLEIAYEDEAMAVVVKPQGMPTQGAHRLSVHTLLPHALAPSALDGRLRRPQHAHRLDAPTGGLLAVAKTHDALVALSRSFAERAVQKTYTALLAPDAWAAAAGGLVGGGAARAAEPPACATGGGYRPLPDAGEIAISLGGKEASTAYAVTRRYRSLGRLRELAAVTLTPHTGRTHQLRRHAAQGLGCARRPRASAYRARARAPADRAAARARAPRALRRSWPIVGEPRGAYASDAFRAASPGRGLFLWASGLALPHPLSGEWLVFERPPPHKFARWPEREAARAAAAGGGSGVGEGEGAPPGPGPGAPARAPPRPPPRC